MYSTAVTPLYAQICCSPGSVQTDKQTKQSRAGFCTLLHCRRAMGLFDMVLSIACSITS